MGYKIECPNCAKDNLYVTPENGIQHCFTPGCGYHTREGAIKEEKKERSPFIVQIRQYYKQMAAYYHSSLDKRALAFLYSRGYTNTYIQENKIGYCPKGAHPLYNSEIARDSGLASFDGKALLGDRIVFPYYARDHVTDLRGRAIERDEELKYKSPLRGSYYRGADYPYHHDLFSKLDYVILTEGEIKADLATIHGYPCMALPGMGIWKQGWKPRDDQRVIILFDSQIDNMWATRYAIRSAARNISDPYVATLPLMGQNKMDIDAFILQYGESAFDMVISGALPFDVWEGYQRF